MTKYDCAAPLGAFQFGFALCERFTQCLHLQIKDRYFIANLFNIRPFFQKNLKRIK